MVCPGVTPTADTLQGLDRSVKPAALLFELLDNFASDHANMLTLEPPGAPLAKTTASLALRKLPQRYRVLVIPAQTCLGLNNYQATADTQLC
jgi:hypothetical protein